MHKVKILQTEFVTHDVKRFILEKPKGYIFDPGQATEVAIDKPEWIEKKHPFTFTSLNNDLVLEFTIKGYKVSEYPSHEGVTEKLHTLIPGDYLLIDDPWGTIKYKGKGVFLAAGAGVTPFIAIIRQLKKDSKLGGHKLLFSNKTAQDVILEKEFRQYFGEDAIFTLSREELLGYEKGRIDENMLKKYISNFNQHFYVCGPGKFVVGMKDILAKLGAKTDSVVFEE